MLAVNVAIMQVINMVTVQHRVVPTPWAVGMAVLLGLLVLDRGHDASLSGGPSHAYMRSYECQEGDALRSRPTVPGVSCSSPRGRCWPSWWSQRRRIVWINAICGTEGDLGRWDDFAAALPGPRDPPMCSTRAWMSTDRARCQG